MPKKREHFAHGCHKVRTKALLFPLHRCLFFSFLKYFRMFDFLKLKFYCRQFETVLRNSTRFPFSLFPFPRFWNNLFIDDNLSPSLSLSLPSSLSNSLSLFTFLSLSLSPQCHELSNKLVPLSLRSNSAWSLVNMSAAEATSEKKKKFQNFCPDFSEEKNLAGLINTDVMNCFTLVE